MLALLWPLLQKILLSMVAAFGERFIENLFGWLKDRDVAAGNVALGQQKARADRLAAEAKLNKDIQDAEDRARTESDDSLRERLRRSLGRSGLGDPGG